MKCLSREPDIPVDIFGRMGGTLEVRVCAINRAGRGDCSTLEVTLSGM